MNCSSMVGREKVWEVQRDMDRDIELSELEQVLTHPEWGQALVLHSWHGNSRKCLHRQPSKKAGTDLCSGKTVEQSYIHPWTVVSWARGTRAALRMSSMPKKSAHSDIEKCCNKWPSRSCCKCGQGNHEDLKVSVWLPQHDGLIKSLNNQPTIPQLKTEEVVEHTLIASHPEEVERSISPYITARSVAIIWAPAICITTWLITGSVAWR